MHLSTPIYRLKRKTRLLARQQAIPQHAALDALAAQEGFQSWSHLTAAPRPTTATALLTRFAPGDMVLLGARPGQGKTRLGLELAAQAQRTGRTGYFFTLEYHAGHLADLFADLGIEADAVIFDTSDAISADHIIRRVKHPDCPAFIVVDYLQLLDQKRSNPSLDHQITALRAHARETGAICILISQIDRAFDLSGKDMPDIPDIRLPNPLDLSRFDRMCFLHAGQIRMRAA